VPSEQELPSKTVTVAGVSLEIAELGQGDPIVFLHGASGVQSNRDCLHLLARSARVIAPSHPGFGRSALPDWLDSVEDIAHVYIAMLDQFGIRKTDIIGCSLGGWIAAEMMTKTPALIGNAVLVGPVGVKTGPSDKLDIPDVFALSPDELDQHIYHSPAERRMDAAKLSDEELAIVYRNRETFALLAWEPYMHNPKLKHRLAAANARTLFVRGESDRLVSAEYLDRYARLVRGSETITLPQSGHLPQIERPEIFVATVSKFLQNRTMKGRPS
jgi:pimeloyl-ACP methyl ester carboxylesterase